jgi:hypothetical protein
MATITAAAGGGNWNVGSTWDGGVVPLTTDDVVLNATSGQVTITATAQCVDINFTGYTNTITFNANLTITGDLTRSASVFSYAGTGGIIIAGTTTQIITTTSVAWTIPVTFGGASPSISINGAFNITAPLTLSSTTSPVIARANVFDLTENVQAFGNIVASSTGIYTGSAAIKVTGSANQAFTGGGNYQIRNDFTIDKSAGIFTISGIFSYNTGTLTYVASGGTVNTTTSNFIISASTILNTNGINWNNVTINSGTIALTLTSDFNIAGTFSATGLGGAITLTFSGAGLFNPTGDFILSNASISGVAIITITLPNNISVSSLTYPSQPSGSSKRDIVLNGSRNITVNGNVSITGGSTTTFSGNCTLIFAGTGTFYLNGATAFSVTYSLPTTINTSGTCTFTTNVIGGNQTSPLFSSTTITYLSGTIAISGTGNNSIIFSACTLNLNAGGLWAADVIIRGSTTLTSGATFGNLTTNTTAVTFTGAFTINVEGNLNINITTQGASTPIIINGTGNQTWTHAANQQLYNSLTINKTSGTLFLGANIYYRTGTFTYISNVGSSVDATTNNNTFFLVASATFNTNVLVLNNFVFTGTSFTVTLLSNLNIGGNTTLQNSGIINFTISVAGSLFNPTGSLSINSIGTINLPNNISVTNFTVSGNSSLYTLVNFNINISGNITVSSNFGIDGSSNLIINGTSSQTWSHTGTGAITKNLTINKSSGTLTLGSTVYFATGTLTYTQGDVDVTTNSSTLIFSNTSTFNNNNLVLNNLQLNTNSAILTLSTDLYCLGEITLGQGGKSILGTYSNIYCNVLRFANNSSAGYIYNFNSANIYTNDLLLQGALSGSAFNIGGNAMIYVNRNLSVTGGIGHGGHYYGNSKIFLTGTGTLSTTSGLTLETTINTSGKITISSILYLGAQGPSGASGTTFNYIKGNVIANNSTLSLQIASASLYNLISMNKIAWGNVVITSGITLNMNEFFCGDAYTKTNVRATTATNYVITFTDGFEKIAKFVNISGCTLTRPQQLLVLTDSKKSSTNRGIRYINSLPNGISKGDPSIQNILTPGQSSNLLIADPAFVKTI